MAIDKATKQTLDEGSQLLRQLAQRGGGQSGWYRTDQDDGSIRIESRDLQIELRGLWATTAADYLLALNPDVGSSLAELLWLLSLPNASDRPANQAARLVELMRRGVSRRT